MTLQDGFFFAFGTCLIVSAISAISARNPVHAALSLVVSFFSCAGLWLLLSAEFLAVVLVLVYVGAVMVLFLFVVMMFNIGPRPASGLIKNFALCALVGVTMALEMIFLLRGSFPDAVPHIRADESESNTGAIGQLLYTDYPMHVELAALVLLVAIIAAVILTLRPTPSGNKVQSPAKQMEIKAADRLRIVDIPSEDKL